MVRGADTDVASTVTLPNSIINLQDNVKVDVNLVGHGARVFKVWNLSYFILNVEGILYVTYKSNDSDNHLIKLLK